MDKKDTKSLGLIVGSVFAGTIFLVLFWLLVYNICLNIDKTEVALTEDSIEELNSDTYNDATIIFKDSSYNLKEVQSIITSPEVVTVVVKDEDTEKEKEYKGYVTFDAKVSEPTVEVNGDIAQVVLPLHKSDSSTEKE